MKHETKLHLSADYKIKPILFNFKCSFPTSNIPGLGNISWYLTTNFTFLLLPFILTFTSLIKKLKKNIFTDTYNYTMSFYCCFNTAIEKEPTVK